MVRKLLQMLLNNRGAVGADGKEIIEAPKGSEKTFTQEQLDHVVQERIAREKAKFADYDDLKKKVSEYDKSQDEKQLKLLEEQKKYDEALKVRDTKMTELQGLVTKKDSEIQDMRISTSLAGAINSQNGYMDATMALLKSQAVIDKEGNVRIKGRDANGLEIMLSVEDGVKGFLTNNPYLVKATQRNGAGTPPGQGGGANTGADDLVSLTEELSQAQMRGDGKKIKELTEKVRLKMKG